MHDVDVDLPARVVTLVLVTRDGGLVGRLPPVSVATPWWQEAGDVVDAVRAAFGLDITVLRLLETERSQPPGGYVTYLAEIAQPVGAQPWAGSLEDHPLRQRWARPGGPAADVAWAESALSALGIRTVGAAEQVRSWNLSSLWRLPTTDQIVWLKVVPPFFAHEGAMLERLASAPVPRLLAHQDTRMLLAEIPGEDLYRAGGSQLLAMVDILVEIQRGWVDRVDELLALGVHDWRTPALCQGITEVIERTAHELDAEDRRVLDGFLSGLPARFEDIAACGLPDTLVHGDFHPGNTRGVGTSITLLDWGDSSVGNPLLDQPAFLGVVPASEMPAIRRHWLRRLEESFPGSRPERAADLLAPIAAARLAVIFRMFLDNIEPSEWPYHAADPADWLHRTALLTRSAP